MAKKISICMLLVLFASVVTSCSLNNKPVETEGFFMGTIISQKVYGKNAKKASDEVADKIKWIESMMTINAPGGDINKLNDSAGGEPVKLDEETIYVLDKAKNFAELSGGAFDVTIGPLVKTWGIFTDHPRIPDQSEINSLLGLVDYNSLNIDKANLTAKLDKPGQIVDLGGIAKGYAGDVAMSIYKSNGIKSAFVNLGGNVVVLGSKPDGTPWKIGIQNPRAENGKYIGIVKVTDKAIVSSGDYERYFEKDNKRYHHIIDPKTGYPSDSGLIGTSIIADLSIDADALSTAIFVLGLDRGMKLVESLKGVDAVFITSDKKVYVTEGLKNNFTFEDESKEFEYVKER